MGARGRRGWDESVPLTVSFAFRAVQVNRNNGNRLFDSQNNAQGGYACPRAVGDETTQDDNGDATLGSLTQNKKIYFYEGSYLPIEWTNQHGCGQNSKANCEIVIQ